jgi:hypothetical protein
VCNYTVESVIANAAARTHRSLRRVVFLINDFFLAQQPNSGLGRLSFEAYSSHIIRHTRGGTPLNE